MKAYTTENIRNLAIIGHGDAGKTQLVSSLLHLAGTTNRWGKVDEGTTVTDYDEDSIERKVTLNNNIAHLNYKDTKINLIDTPGYAAFVSHARPALRVADCALVIVDGVNGIEVQTEKRGAMLTNLCCRVLWLSTNWTRNARILDTRSTRQPILLPVQLCRSPCQSVPKRIFAELLT